MTTDSIDASEPTKLNRFHGFIELIVVFCTPLASDYAILLRCYWWISTDNKKDLTVTQSVADDKKRETHRARPPTRVGVLPGTKLSSSSSRNTCNNRLMVSELREELMHFSFAPEFKY